MASRKVDDLLPELRYKYVLFAEKMAAAGINFILTCTYRSKEEQEALYCQGREPLSYVNGLRKALGLPALTHDENAKVITWTLNSKHIERKAFDIAITEGGKIIWNSPLLYKHAGEIGESVGLTWGGRWKTPDMPHFQIS